MQGPYSGEAMAKPRADQAARRPSAAPSRHPGPYSGKSVIDYHCIYGFDGARLGPRYRFRQVVPQHRHVASKGSGARDKGSEAAGGNACARFVQPSDGCRLRARAGVLATAAGIFSQANRRRRHRPPAAGACGAVGPGVWLPGRIEAQLGHAARPARCVRRRDFLPPADPPRRRPGRRVARAASRAGAGRHAVAGGILRSVHRNFRRARLFRATTISTARVRTASVITRRQRATAAVARPRSAICVRRCSDAICRSSPKR